MFGGVGGLPGGSRGAQGAQKTSNIICLTVSPKKLFFWPVYPPPLAPRCAAHRGDQIPLSFVQIHCNRTMFRAMFRVSTFLIIFKIWALARLPPKLRSGGVGTHLYSCFGNETCILFSLAVLGLFWPRTVSGPGGIASLDPFHPQCTCPEVGGPKSDHFCAIFCFAREPPQDLGHIGGIRSHLV